MRLLFISFVILFGLIDSVKLTDRIVGGVNVEIEDYPHQVSVQLYGQHFCGGSIISSTIILTAAHCVDGIDDSEFSIRYGHTYHSQGISIKVKEVRKNRDFDPGTLRNDVAILKLSSAIRFSPKAQAIALTDMDIAAGITAWVSGWGVLKEGSEEIPAHLQAVDVQVITNAQCNSNYTGKISVGMICAETVGHDACKGDSGGPLVSGGKLIGMVSWGYGCARPQYPGVYTKVYHYRDWIRRNSY